MRYRHDKYKQKVLGTVPSVAIFQLAEVTHTKKYNKLYHNIFHLPHQYNFNFSILLTLLVIGMFCLSINFFGFLLFSFFLFFLFFFFFFWGGGGGGVVLI